MSHHPEHQSSSAPFGLSRRTFLQLSTGTLGYALLTGEIALADAVSPPPGNAANPFKPMAQAFSFQEAKLLEGPFKAAQDRNLSYLLSLDLGSLGRSFLLTAGFPSTAPSLGGWEDDKCELRGHFVGHYLSACSEMFADTDNAALKDRVDSLVGVMARCQDAIGTGYLSAFYEEEFDRLEAHKPVWVPWYAVHKVYQGLVDAYLLCGNQQALDALKKAADWVDRRTGKLSEAAMQRTLEIEHGGMMDVLVKLALVTGDENYLTVARRFWHHRVLDPVMAGQDKLTGLHANTQFPKIQGIARFYESTGDAKYRDGVRFFWTDVTSRRSYVTGGNSDGEHFRDPAHLSQELSPNSTETCNVFNMLKITHDLFRFEAGAGYADYYERALFNQILASQDPATGSLTYYQPLVPCLLKYGEMNTESGPHNFWCCCGTGIQNHARHANSIYFHDADKTLYVNLFIASTLDWKEGGVKLRQETPFPEVGATKLTMTCDQPREFTLALRRPSWAKEGFAISVNGQAQVRPIAVNAGEFVKISRTWANGDVVDVVAPMQLRTESFQDNPQRLAVLYGPIVLCHSTPDADPNHGGTLAVADAQKLLDGITPVAGKPLTFRGSAEVFGAEAGDVTLIPFYRHWDNQLMPYRVYWDLAKA